MFTNSLIFLVSSTFMNLQCTYFLISSHFLHPAFAWCYIFNNKVNRLLIWHQEGIRFTKWKVGLAMSSLYKGVSMYFYILGTLP